MALAPTTFFTTPPMVSNVAFASEPACPISSPHTSDTGPSLYHWHKLSRICSACTRFPLPLDTGSIQSCWFSESNNGNTSRNRRLNYTWLRDASGYVRSEAGKLVAWSRNLTVVDICRLVSLRRRCMMVDMSDSGLDYIHHADP